MAESPEPCSSCVPVEVPRAEFVSSWFPLMGDGDDVARERVGLADA